ncbi:MAG: hypothetical protein MUO29_08935, partial [Desulfobacterales bacterium]|nr:hypothetical protein [Desulfobacterales bacterium]
MSRVKSTRHNLFENHQKPFSSLPAYQYDDLIMALFVTVVLISNIASSAKIVDWGVAICGLRLAFDAGT